MGTRTITLHELADELPRALEYARVDRHAHVIVSSGAAYIQFAFPEGWILGEAVSNYYLAEEDLLEYDDEIVLDILGWREPGTDRDGEPHLNFFREWHDDTPSATIADDVVRTLSEVYLHNHYGIVELQVFTCEFCEDNESRGFGDDMDVAS